MNLRHALPVALLACLSAMPAGAQPAKQSKDDAKATPAQAAAETKSGEAASADGAAATDGVAGGMMGGGMSMGGFDFDTIQGEKISMVQEPGGKGGSLIIDGKAVIKSPQLNLTCDHLNMNPDTKMLVAEGSPVKADQGEDFKAECRHLTYDINKKLTRLEGSPVIYRKDADGGYIRTIGDIITITQNENGGTAVSIETLKNSNRLPTIDKLDSNMQKVTKKKPAPAKKVSGSKNDLQLIKAPEVMSSKAPGVE